MHGEFLLINGGKMSKSLGNVYLMEDIIQRGYNPLVYKIFCFTAHYRNKLNFTWEGMDAAATSLARLQEGYYKHLEGNKTISQEVIQEYKQKFLEAINDDLNMPLAMSVVWDVVKQPEKSKQYADLLLDFDKVLGLRLQETQRQETTSLELPPEIEELLQKRKEARERKDWAMSDSIRDALKEKGYQVIDSKEGMKVEKIK